MVCALPLSDPTARSAVLARRQRKPRACVIGAGISGLVSAKALIDRGIPFDCFEISDRVGGLWVFKNKNGRSAAYRSLHINTSRERMQLRDFPMPREFPDYPHHELMASYFQSYAKAFGLSGHIRFETPVVKVVPKNGRYEVTLGDQSRLEYDAVLVANGHHFEPQLAPTPGSFDGVELHARDYVDPTEPHELRGRRVVVVGFGNSAVDIACELAKHSAAGSVMLSVRRGAWVLPKYVFGRPIDQTRALPNFFPRRLRQLLSELWYRKTVGDPGRFGLPEPDHRIGDAHPTLSNELLSLIDAKRIAPKPAIVAREGHEVCFADGTRERADAIIYATGYKISFPFFDPAFVEAPNNELLLHLRVFHPDNPRLYFIGLCQPLGPLLPVAEAQAKLVAAHLAGTYRTPPPERMRRQALRERELVRQRFGNSGRHTLQLDFDGYLAEVRKLLENSS